MTNVFKVGELRQKLFEREFYARRPRRALVPSPRANQQTLRIGRARANSVATRARVHFEISPELFRAIKAAVATSGTSQNEFGTTALYDRVTKRTSTTAPSMVELERVVAKLDAVRDDVQNIRRKMFGDTWTPPRPTTHGLHRR